MYFGQFPQVCTLIRKRPMAGHQRKHHNQPYQGGHTSPMHGGMGHYNQGGNQGWSQQQHNNQGWNQQQNIKTGWGQP